MLEKEFERPFETIDRLEERAASLQTGLPIVATVVLVGGALVADRTKVCGRGWQAALGASLGFVLVMLALGTFFALLTTTRRAGRAYPGEAALATLSHPTPDAERAYVVQMLASTRYNDRIRRWKLARMHTASFCVGLALLGFLVFAGVLAAYGIAQPACASSTQRPLVVVHIPAETEHEGISSREFRDRRDSNDREHRGTDR